MAIEFSDDLITGNHMIDTQHRELIDRVNNLLQSLDHGEDQKEVTRLLLYLASYTNFHFKAEEALQRELDYPGYEEHVIKHKELINTVAELETILENEGITPSFKERFKKEVLDWLLYHIKGFDRSVAEFKFMRDNPNLL